jgi:RNA polymerase sigma-70 factor (ECF subfamily)
VETHVETIGRVAVHGSNDRSNETALIRAAQGGDAEAFEQLVRSYDQSVLRMALNLLHSQEDARDVYQEAFLRVYRKLPQFRFDCSFSTWLYRIVANLCLDQIRKRKVRKEEGSAVTTPSGEMDRFQFLPEQRADVDPQRQLLSSEVSSRISSVLETLTPRERLVFEMRHYQGMRCGRLANRWASLRRQPRTVCFEPLRRCAQHSEILYDLLANTDEFVALPLW